MSAPTARLDPAELAAFAEALERAASWVRRTTPRAEWNPAALSTLVRLARTGPQRVSDLADREAASQPGMTGLVGRLATAGLVERAADPTDGRATLVSITEAGRDHLRERHALRAAQVATHLHRLSTAEQRSLVAATEALIALAVSEEHVS
jgi:DNA-binding MarR family transcriptional regulator